MTELTHLQMDVIEQLAEKYGRVCISRADSPEYRRVTVPSGASFMVHEDGHVVRRGTDFSIDWSTEEVV